MGAFPQDFDGGPIGSAVIQAYMNNTGQQEQLTWSVVPASSFPNGEADVAKAVVDNHAWAIVTSMHLPSDTRYSD